MSAENWRELLRRDGIEECITRAIRVVESRSRAIYGTREDYEAYAWDHAVTLAEKYDGDDPGFEKWLYVALTTFGPMSNRARLTGRPGGERWAGWYGTSLDEVKAEATDRSAGGDWLEGAASLSARRIFPDDPLAILLRVDFLERLVRRAQVKGTYARSLPYVTRSGDHLCAEAMCLREAVIAGRCKPHYQARRAKWGELPACAAPECTEGSTTRGYCEKHYLRERRRLKNEGAVWPDQVSEVPAELQCVTEGCDRRAVKRQLCRHHDQERWDTEGPRCAVEGCTRGANGGRGMCRNHYERARLRGWST